MKYSFFLLGLIACYAPGMTEQALLEAGYTEVVIHGPGFFSCGKDDTYNTAFTAKSPGGTTANGNVCCGIFKGCTIRL